MKRPLTQAACKKIVESLGMSLGEGESRGLAFTVCGGQLVNGEDAPEWIKGMNGWDIEAIAKKAISRTPAE